MSQENMLVVVHCYAGDAHQVDSFMPEYRHHGCPVLLLSPEDQPVNVDLDGVECRSAGKACYIGRDALERQIEHLKIIDEYPQDWFLLHDSDSVCVSPDIPTYLFDDKNVLWGNEVDTRYYIGPQGATAEEIRRFKFSYQPPVFFSHTALKKMLRVADKAIEDVPEYAQMIDYMFAALARRAGITARPFIGNFSRGIFTNWEAAFARLMIESMGTRMIHSIKRRDILDTIRFGPPATVAWVEQDIQRLKETVRE